MLADLEQEGGRPNRSTLPTPVAFICQQDFVRPVTTADVSMTAMPSVSPGALRPLTVFMVERADGWRLSCEVDNHVVSQEAGFRLLEDFQRLLSVIATAAEESLAEIGARAVCPRLREQVEEAAAEGAEKTAEVWSGFPATEFQRRFWRLDTLNPGGVAFHVRVRLQLRGRLDVDALARAIATVARRNEILRTTLEEENDQVWQVIHPELPIDFRSMISDVQGPDEVALRGAAACGPCRDRPRWANRIFADKRPTVSGESAATGKESSLAGDYAFSRHRGLDGPPEFFWNNCSRRMNRKLALKIQARNPRPCSFPCYARDRAKAAGESGKRSQACMVADISQRSLDSDGTAERFAGVKRTRASDARAGLVTE